MPFRNQTISTTNLNATNLYGDKITSGGTDIGLFSYNRRIYGNSRNYQFSTGTTAIETLMESFSFPAGTLTPSSSIEIFASWEQVSANLSQKITRWRFGSAKTTSDSLIWANGNTTNGTAAYITWLKLPFFGNSNAHAYSVGVTNYGFQLPTTYAPITGFDISTQTTYLSVFTNRPAAGDSICLKNLDIFLS